MDVPVQPVSATAAVAPTPDGAADLLLRQGVIGTPDRRAAIMLPAPPVPVAMRRLLEAAEAAAGAGAPVAFRPDGLSALAGLDRRWQDVRLPDGSERFETVRVPAGLLAAPGMALTTVAPGDGIAASPIGMLAAFVHPRNRLVAAAGRDPALLAELASAIPVRLVLAAGAFEGAGVAFSASDLVSAQLLWAAVSQRDDGRDPERQVAWERPEVQRAIALGGGPRRPQELALRLVVDPAMARLIDQLADRLRGALGPVTVDVRPG